MHQATTVNDCDEEGTERAWEYFVAPLLEHNPGEILNTFGDDGWELVSVVAQPTPAGGVDSSPT